MKVILTENQYNRLLENHWDAEKLYDRERVVEALRKGPKYIREYIKKLPKIPVQNEKGLLVGVLENIDDDPNYLQV